jgi:hypothetical protein
MSDGTGQNGWQRFLDRLKQLWGKTRGGGLTPAGPAGAG